jgi:site-specific recombinase XerD
MLRAAIMSQDPPAAPHPAVTTFLGELARRDAAATTRASYRQDLTHFAAWFGKSTGEAFSPQAITPTDIRDYRTHLQTVERRAPATINRRLAALRAFFRYCVAGKQVAESPMDAVKGVAAAPRAPRSLEKRELDKLIRAVERHGSARDQAVLLTLRHTGIRVGELCALTLSDIVVSERTGSLTVRSGKGASSASCPSTSTSGGPSAPTGSSAR